MSEELLRRAILLFDKIWLAYREEIYADQTDQIVWKSPRRLVLRSGCLERITRKRPSTSSPLIEFPEHLCKKPHDRVVLLNFLQCNVAVTHMQCVLEWLLQDICVTIEVAVFLLKDPPLVVILEPDGNPSIRNSDYKHVCWRVALKSGEVFAVDVTGAQYGWYDSLCPWTECLEMRCLKEIMRIGFRDDEKITPLITQDASIPGFTPPRVDNYYVSVQEHFSKGMVAYLKSLPVMDALVIDKSRGRAIENDLIEQVKKQATAATLAADSIWETFPWSVIWEQPTDAALVERANKIHEAIKKLQL